MVVASTSAKTQWEVTSVPVTMDLLSMRTSMTAKKVKAWKAQCISVSREVTSRKSFYSNFHELFVEFQPLIDIEFNVLLSF